MKGGENVTNPAEEFPLGRLCRLEKAICFRNIWKRGGGGDIVHTHKGESSRQKRLLPRCLPPKKTKKGFGEGRGKGKGRGESDGEGKEAGGEEGRRKRKKWGGSGDGGVGGGGQIRAPSCTLIWGFLVEVHATTKRRLPKTTRGKGKATRAKEKTGARWVDKQTVPGENRHCEKQKNEKVTRFRKG